MYMNRGKVKSEAGRIVSAADEIRTGPRAPLSRWQALQVGFWAWYGNLIEARQRRLRKACAVAAARRGVPSPGMHGTPQRGWDALELERKPDLGPGGAAKVRAAEAETRREQQRLANEAADRALVTAGQAGREWGRAD